MPDAEIRNLEGDAAREAAGRIRRGLVAYNEPRAGPLNVQAMVLSLADDRGDVIGGLVGESFWNALHIELVWVADANRGRGYGKRLMEAAEAQARARGVGIVYLNTFSFQSPGFYERLGYSKFGELADVAKGAKRIWYAKAIGETRT